MRYEYHKSIAASDLLSVSVHIISGMKYIFIHKIHSTSTEHQQAKKEEKLHNNKNTHSCVKWEILVIIDTIFPLNKLRNRKHGTIEIHYLHSSITLSMVEAIIWYLNNFPFIHKVRVKANSWSHDRNTLCAVPPYRQR